jgi:23S rRNA (uracil1939-C5)-methyltransferase
MLTAGDVLTLHIERPAAGGRMIAHSGSGIVLVAGAIPGERVQARVERVRKGVAFAATIAVDEAAVDRREPFTDPSCGGCLYAHIAYPRQVTIKAQVIADAFGRIGRIPLPATVPVTPSRDDGYRMRARLHMQGGRIGFFREESHQLCDARATRQLLTDTCDVLEQLADRLRVVAPEAVHQLDVSENSDASQRAVHLDATGQLDRAVLRGLGPATGLTGLSVTPVEVLSGDPYLVDTLDVLGQSVTLRRHVLAFFQGNRYLLRELVSHVVGQVQAGAEVTDLYAGAGLFSVAAAVVRGARVTAVEGDRIAALDLQANAAAARGGSVSAVHRPVEEFVAAARGAGPAVLIVDPPRTGMSKEALDGVIRLRPGTIVYVSCDVATLARDARRLLDAGYQLQQVHGFDLFPNTPHVETVATFIS